MRIIATDGRRMTAKARLACAKKGGLPIKPILRLLIFAFVFISVPAMAQGISGVVISTSAGTARVLIPSDTLPAPDARLTVAQNEVLGASLASGVATVTGVQGSVISVTTDSPLRPGPIVIQIIEGEEIVAGGEATPPGTGAGVEEIAGGQRASEQDLDKILPLVREWIAIAEPLENAEPGYRLKYSNWAQLYGATPTGTITINANPDDTGGLEYDMYLWTRYPDLPSLSHCTLKEYVLAKLAGDPIEACRGHYPATPTFAIGDFTGQPADQARQELVAKQLKVEIRPGDPAPSGTLENTVAAQAPGSGTQVQSGQSVTLTIYGDYAVPGDESEKIEQAVGNCRFDDAARLIAAIDTDKARRPYSRRYDEAFAREGKTKALFAEADEFFLSCDYEEARNSLGDANANTRCERYRTRISQAVRKVKAAAVREATTRILFGEADQLFKRRDYYTSLAKLNGARANTRCERYISRIEAAIARVEDRIGQPAIASGQESPPSGQAVPPGNGAPSGVDASYIIGLWALSRDACEGTTPPRNRESSTPGSIGEAIEQGIAEAMETMVMTAMFKFDANGVLSMVGPEGQSEVVGNWRIDDDVLTTHVDDEDHRARILEKHADRFVFHDPSSGEKVSFFRCGSEREIDAGDESSLGDDSTQDRDSSVLVTSAFATSSARGGGSEYHSAASEMYIDPSTTLWIAWNATPEISRRDDSAGGGPFLWGGGGFGTDDFVRLTVVSPGGRSATIDMDRNDALGAHRRSDPMNVIFGAASDAPDALRIDAFGASKGRRMVFDEPGAFNSVFTEAGMYEFRFSFRNAHGSNAGHGDIYLLKKTL